MDDEYNFVSSKRKRFCFHFAHSRPRRFFFCGGKRVFESLDKFRNVKLKEPVFEIIMSKTSEDLACDCGANNQLYIVYQLICWLQSLLCCADCFMPVLLYKIPRLTRAIITKRFCWQSDYKYDLCK